MAYVEFHQPPKGSKKQSEGQQVGEESPPTSFRPRPKSKESFGQLFSLPGRSPPPPQPATQSVTFKFKEMLENERPALAAMFPMTRLPGTTEYIIISDSESEPDEQGEAQTSKKKKKAAKAREVHGEERTNAAAPPTHLSHPTDGTTTTTKEATEADNEELVKLDRTFKEKLNHLTKDLGNLLSQPKSNLREFLRRREGYEPADNHKRVSHLSDDDEEQLIVAKTPPS